MEKLSKASQSVQQNNPSNQKEANDKIQDGKLELKQETPDEGKFGLSNHVILRDFQIFSQRTFAGEGLQNCNLAILAPQR